MQETEKPKRGRPAGPKSETYARRLQAWRAWWPVRPRTATQAVLAEHMKKTMYTIARWASTHQPPENELKKLEQHCAVFGYVPPA